MKCIKANYHSLHALNFSQPKLRKAVISKGDKELVNYIIEYVLNVLNGNITLTGCNTRELRKHKVALRKLCEKHVPISGMK